MAKMPISTHPNSAALATVLQTDSVSCDIVRFLLQNESAMDSTKGIAAWWIHRDEVAVQPSLHRLCACGALWAHTLSSGTTLYGLTQDAEIRASLRDRLGMPDDQRPSSHHQVAQEKGATSVSNT